MLDLDFDLDHEDSVTIDPDPNDPRRTLVRFSPHGPSMSLGVTLERLTALLQSSPFVLPPHHGLDPDESGFLYDGFGGRWDDDDTDPTPNTVYLEIHPDSLQRTLARFGKLGIRRTLDIPILELVEYLLDPTLVEFDEALPQLSDAQRAFVIDHLLQIDGLRAQIIIQIEPPAPFEFYEADEAQRRQNALQKRLSA